MARYRILRENGCVAFELSNGASGIRHLLYRLPRLASIASVRRSPVGRTVQPQSWKWKKYHRHERGNTESIRVTDRPTDRPYDLLKVLYPCRCSLIRPNIHHRYRCFCCCCVVQLMCVAHNYFSAKVPSASLSIDPGIH
jgi:hypothetical protein